MIEDRMRFQNALPSSIFDPRSSFFSSLSPSLPFLLKELVAWLRRAMHRPAALPQPTRVQRQSRLLLHHAAEPRDEPERKT